MHHLRPGPMPCPHLNYRSPQGPRSPLTRQGPHPWRGESDTDSQAREQGATGPPPTERAWAALRPDARPDAPRSIRRRGRRECAQTARVCTACTQHNTTHGRADGTHVCKRLGHVYTPHTRCTHRAHVRDAHRALLQACLHGHRARAHAQARGFAGAHSSEPALRRRVRFPNCLSRGRAPSWETAAPQGTPPLTPAVTWLLWLWSPLQLRRAGQRAWGRQGPRWPGGSCYQHWLPPGCGQAPGWRGEAARARPGTSLPSAAQPDPSPVTSLAAAAPRPDRAQDERSRPPLGRRGPGEGQ